MNAVNFDCCGGCIPLEAGQSVQDVIDIHSMQCEERERLNFLAAHRDDMYRDVATMHDVDARWQNEQAEWMEDHPLEISGDAIAEYKEKHP